MNGTAGTTLTPEAALESSAGLIAGEQLTASLVKQMPPSSIISSQLNAMCDKLASYIRGGFSTEPKEFLQLCLYLSKYIDYAVEHNEGLPKGSNLPLVLKQISQCRNIPHFRPVIFVLMISVKNACRSGWFPEKENDELFRLAIEVAGSIPGLGEFKTGLSICQSTISTIMARFYPRMKMGQILTYIEAKPGYEAYMSDFHIPKNIVSPRENIRLFVAHTDKLETSACIISPPQVNFLINGKGVDRRTNTLMDTGPQMPTDVTKLLKYGTNILQSVGQFNGHYIIVVAFMSVTSSPDVPTLPDYVRPPLVELDEDCDIIEGPSRISLNCPISFTRMKTPVKGRLCKHHQASTLICKYHAFAFSSFSADKFSVLHDPLIFFSQVLNQVGKDVSDIIISANGSWKAVMDTDDQIHDSAINCTKKKSEQQESTGLLNAPPDVLDLTEDDNEVDVFRTSEIEDRKPFQEYNQNAAAAPRVEDNYWNGVYFTCGLGTSTARSDTHMFGSTSQSTADFVQAPPVLTDAISPVISQEDQGRLNSNLTASEIQSQLPSDNTLQLQQLQYPISNEYGRFPTVPRMVNRMPIAVQALPASSQVPGPQQRSRTSLNSSTPISSSTSQVPLAPAANGFNTPCSDVERQRLFSRSHLNPFDVASSSSQHSSVTQVPLAPAANGFNTLCSDVERQRLFSRSHLNPFDVASSSSQHSSVTQVPLAPAANGFNTLCSDVERQRLFSRSHLNPFDVASSSSQHSSVTQSVQQVVSSQLPRAYIPSLGLSDFRNAHLQQALNPRISQPMGHSSNVNQSPYHSQTQARQGSSQVRTDFIPGTGNSQPDRIMAVQQALQRIPVQNQTSRSGLSLPMSAQGLRGPTSDTLDLPSEQNWRPGQMRGSLSGQAYVEALSHLRGGRTPTQLAQPARPQSNLTSSLPTVPSQRHILVASNRNAHASQMHTNDIQ
ncbi:hypothetical protein FEM48_Zijuj11G0028000 [Ziziphus jujuba var. spinosa]|uniref:SP-RING-type domain-containing protein n=1 Tax=Ziziphus jujuba var. spinosa TaxID=714518 RepID=A0A978UGD5_ZIZJJ|nr:hypothetical protein FEM48_Zijuj11G0028000 [Ziziphus jujuba var. spinosa]